MSERDWGSNFAIGGWVVAGVLAALLYSEKVADRSSSGGGKSQHQTDRSTPQTAIAKSNRPPPSSFKREPPPQEHQPDCTKSENGDLCAQRRMAAAAEEQTRLNILGLVLLAGTLWFTGRAAMYARDAAKATRDSAVAAEVSATAADKTTRATIEAAEASKRSADAAEQALRGLERPYLFLKTSGEFHAMGTGRDGLSRSMLHSRPHVRFSFANYGRLPAIPTSLSVEFKRLSQLPQAIVHVPNTELDPTEIVEASGKETRTFSRYLEYYTLNEEELASVESEQSFLWF